MIEPIPLIYVGSRVEPSLGWVARSVALLVALGCLATLVTAARLRPDGSGMGTHRQLGLAECGLLARAGIPCMTCGMTTSFTHLAHGQPLASLRAQPAGTIFAMLSACAVWIGFYIAATGRPAARIWNRLPLTGFCLTLLGIGLIGWAYKIVVVLRATNA